MLVPIVITHDVAEYTKERLAEAGIVPDECFDIRAINMEESPIEADDAWARAAELYGDLTPDAVPYIIMIDAELGRKAESICKDVLKGDALSPEMEELLSQISEA